MPLQSYQSKRRKLGSSSTSTSAAAAASSTSLPSSSTSTNKPYNARPSTPAKRPSTAKLTSTTSKSTPKSTAATAAGTKKRRASVVYVDASNDEAALPVYMVEAINKHCKAKDRHCQYLIKWEGYPESQNVG